MPQVHDGGSLNCFHLLNKRIRSYVPYLDAASCTRNLQTFHSVLSKYPLNIDLHFSDIHYNVLI